MCDVASLAGGAAPARVWTAPGGAAVSGPPLPPEPDPFLEALHLADDAGAMLEYRDAPGATETETASEAKAAAPETKAAETEA